MVNNLGMYKKVGMTLEFIAIGALIHSSIRRFNL